MNDDECSLSPVGLPVDCCWLSASIGGGGEGKREAGRPHQQGGSFTGTEHPRQQGARDHRSSHEHALRVDPPVRSLEDDEVDAARQTATIPLQPKAQLV